MRVNDPFKNVEYLPVWKKDASAAEVFHEMAMVASKKPERFPRMVIIWDYDEPSGATVVDYHCRGVSTREFLGLLELCKAEVLRNTQGTK